MALGAALVDRARPVVRRASGARVEGRTVYGETRGSWFRCRLILPASPETADAPAGTRPVVRTPTLLFGTRDQDGGALALTNAMRLEVDSKQLGQAMWEVAGDPEPLRKRRSVLGFQASLRRVETHPADEVEEDFD